MANGTRHREEVLNVALAACISARGMHADPETILRRGAVRPDVMATFRGLRCAIEGKTGDVPLATAHVLEDARGRISQGIAHLAIAAVYPRELRSIDIMHLNQEMGRARLEFTILADENAEANWRSGGITEIVAELRRVHDTLVRDPVLQEAVGLLRIGIEEVANAVLSSKATAERIVTVIGVGGKPNAAPV